jgi:hypothetical protein
MSLRGTNEHIEGVWNCIWSSGIMALYHLTVIPSVLEGNQAGMPLCVFRKRTRVYECIHYYPYLRDFVHVRTLLVNADTTRKLLVVLLVQAIRQQPHFQQEHHKVTR